MVALSEVELVESVVVFTLGGDGLETGFGANCVAVAGRDATAVVDPLVAPAHARLVDAALRRRGLPPVAWVIATHHHTDHVLGAPVFTGQGARLVAHRAAAARMAADHASLIAARRQDPALRALFDEAVPCVPDVVVDRSMELDLGGRRVEVRPLGHGHTPGDCAVLLPGDGAVCCGDVAQDRYHLNHEDADDAGLRARLLELAALADHGYSRFIPGHGAPGGRELVEGQLRYLDEVSRIVAESPSRDAARAAILARFPGWRLEPAIATSLARRWS